MPQNRIRELRQKKKLSQLQLSIELEVTQETISAYEHSKHLPSLQISFRCTKIFLCICVYFVLEYVQILKERHGE